MTSLHEHKMEKVQKNIVPLEVAVFGTIDALRAQALGAKRLELNAHGSYGQGGLTPPASDLKAIAPNLKIPVRIMIRPRGPPADQNEQDFIYTDEEFETMKTELKSFLDLRVMNPLRGDGFVFGILKPAIKTEEDSSDSATPEVKYEIDAERCRQLIDMAKPYSCIFHRAFDGLADDDDHWETSLHTLVNTGFHGVLTSGGSDAFFTNLKKFHRMCHLTVGKRFQIVIGGGVRSHNVSDFIEKLAIARDLDVWLHTAAYSDAEAEVHGLDTDKLTNLLKVLGTARPD